MKNLFVGFLAVMVAFMAAGCSGDDDDCDCPEVVRLYAEAAQRGGSPNQAEVALAQAGCDDSSPSPDGFRPETEVVLEDAIWMTQQQFGPPSDYPSNNCGPTTLEMAWAYEVGETPNFDPDVINMITWMDENIESYGGTGEQYQGSSTNPSEIEYTSSEYLGLPAEAFGDDLCSSSIGGLEGLYGELLAGRPVYISTYDQPILGVNEDESPQEMTDEGAGHAMLLVGMTPTEVIFHDPLQYYPEWGEYRRFSIESFEQVGWNSHKGVRFMT